MVLIDYFFRSEFEAVFTDEFRNYPVIQADLKESCQGCHKKCSEMDSGMSSGLSSAIHAGIHSGMNSGIEFGNALRAGFKDEVGLNSRITNRRCI